MTHLDRLMGALLALAAALIAFLAAGVLVGAGGSSAVAHPEFEPMLRGVDGGTLGAPTWAIYAVGLIVIAMMWVCLQIGFKRHGWIRKAATVWSIGYGLAFVALMRSYASYAAGSGDIVAGFTRPAAWMVYGIGLSPWVLLLIITYAFDGAYFGDDDQARLDTILAESRADGSDH